MYACRYGQIVVFAYDAAEQNAAEVEEELKSLNNEKLTDAGTADAAVLSPEVMSEVEQADSLMAFLKTCDERKQKLIEEAEGRDGSLDEICKYWMTGDYDGFATFCLPETNQPILKDRNKKWLPKILAAMREKPTMFVFGSGHLVGEEGIIAKLREAGYRVEQVKNKSL